MEKVYTLIVESLTEIVELATYNPFILIVFALLAAFGILGQLVLYYKGCK